MRERVIGIFLEVIGAAVGGFLGYIVFLWLVRQGFYGLMIPGGLLGFGCGLVARERSFVRGILCAVAALLLELYAEWKAFPFVADESFTFMVTHFHEKAQIKILMLVGGVILAFWLGKDAGVGRGGPRSKPTQPTSDADSPE